MQTIITLFIIATSFLSLNSMVCQPSFYSADDVFRNDSIREFERTLATKSMDCSKMPTPELLTDMSNPLVLFYHACSKAYKKIQKK